MPATDARFPTPLPMPAHGRDTPHSDVSAHRIESGMKKLMLSLAFAVLALPLSARADHLDGAFHSAANGHFIITDPAHNNQQHSFSHSDKVPMVDDAGVAVDHHTLKAGHPMTVHYSGQGDHRAVTKVIVHKRRDHKN